MRFSACGRFVALALESRDVVLLKGRATFSDDSTMLKDVHVPRGGTGRGHAQVVTGIDWNAANSPDMPAEGSFLRTSGSCHELMHWHVDSSGKMRQLERAGIRVRRWSSRGS